MLFFQIYASIIFLKFRNVSSLRFNHCFKSITWKEVWKMIRCACNRFRQHNEKFLGNFLELLNEKLFKLIKNIYITQNQTSCKSNKTSISVQKMLHPQNQILLKYVPISTLITQIRISNLIEYPTSYIMSFYATILYLILRMWHRSSPCSCFNFPSATLFSCSPLDHFLIRWRCEKIDRFHVYLRRHGRERCKCFWKFFR